MRRSKRDYYGSLNERNICDNKKCWKVVKPCLSNKVISNEKITLIEGDKVIKHDKETAKVLNNFLSNIIKNLSISQFNPEDPICEKILDPLVRVIARYRKHPSIVAINRKCDSKLRFDLQFIDRKNVLKEIKNQFKSKATQESDTATKMIKDNSDIVIDFILSTLNTCIANSEFPSSLKLANTTPVP